MPALEPAFFIGVVLTLLAISAIGILAIKKVSSSEDFAVGGRKSTAIMVAGGILGSIVGGGGTVGTVQTGYTTGLTGWWQTFGLGIGCLILGVFFANHLYKTRVETVPQVLIKTYGPNIGPLTSFFGSIAIFFSILSQLKSFMPLLTTIAPFPKDMAAYYAAGIGILLALAYVLFGGLWGSSMAGLFKMVLIYFAMLVCGLLAFGKLMDVPNLSEVLKPSYFSMFAGKGGVPGNLGTGISLALGVLVTQIYIQSVLSAKDAKAARNGAYISAFLTFPLGLLGVAIGMYMKTAMPDIENTAEVLPIFFMTYMPQLLAGIFIATLMITTIGSFSGLTLGVSTMLVRDIYTKIRKTATDKENLLALRLSIVVVCLAAFYFATSAAGTAIQSFVFLSFGLRTCVFLIPMMFAFFYKGKVSPAAGIASVLAGPAANLVWNLMKQNVTKLAAAAEKAKDMGLIEQLKPQVEFYMIWDPIYIGLAAGLIAFIVVNAMTQNKAVPTMAMETK